MNKVWLVILVSLTLLVGIVCGYFFLTEPVEIKIPVYPKGEAARNRFYAAESLMKALGYQAHTLGSLQQLSKVPEQATLVLTSTSVIDNRDQKHKRMLIDWVKRGGHLWISPSATDINFLKRKDLPGGETLLTQLGISPKKRYVRVGKTVASAKKKADQLPVFERLTVDKHSVQAQLWSRAVTFSLETESLPVWETKVKVSANTTKEQRRNDTPLSIWEDLEDEKDDEWEHTEEVPKSEKVEPQEQTLMARYRLDKGWVTVASADAFVNPQPFSLFNIQQPSIKSAQNAKLFVLLATLPNEKRPVYIALQTKYPNLAEWLWEKAQPVVITFAGLLIFGLWSFMPKFGPLLPPVSPHRPGLMTHLKAVGNYHLKQQDFMTLLKPMRDEAERLLLPMRALHPDLDTSVRLAARVAKMPLVEVGEALIRIPQDKIHFIRQMQTLTKLLNTLYRVRGTAQQSAN